MKLDAWLEEDHSLDERLRVIECLCQAVNEVHDQGEALAALEPGRIEVSPGRRCDLSAAVHGSPAPPYAAPDAGKVPTASANVYAAGVIAWEILAGRSASRSPRDLSEVRPDLSSELAAAVMACLEPSAEWRPKDLTYLAQMAAARQSNAGRIPDTPREPLLPRPAPARASSRRPSRRTWPLLAALVVVLGIAAWQWSDYLDLGRTPVHRSPSPSAPATTAKTPGVPAVTVPTATEPPAAPATTVPPDEDPVPTPATHPDLDPPTPPPSRVGPTGRQEAAPLSLPAPRPEGEPAAPPVRVAPPVTTPPPSETAPPERAAPPPPVDPLETIASGDTSPGSTAEDRPPPPDSGARAATAAPATPTEPAVLDGVSPREMTRPGRVLLDLRGRRFQPRHQVRVLPVKKVPWGIKIVREKHVSDTLITVLVELSEEVEPGDYAFAVEDGLGARSDPVVFTVTK